MGHPAQLAAGARGVHQHRSPRGLDPGRLVGEEGEHRRRLGGGADGDLRSRHGVPAELVGEIGDGELARAGEVVDAGLAVAEDGSDIDVRDPHALKMHAIAAGAGDDPEALFEGLVALTEVFGTDLADNAVFRKTVVGHLESLFDEGARATVKKVAG